MDIVQFNLYKTIAEWLDEHKSYWADKGFTINIEEPSVGREKNSMRIEVEKERVLSDIQIWETGECDFLQLDKETEKNKYFKNVILTSADQTQWELDNFFFNFDSLSGSSIDPSHNSEN